MKRTLFLPFAIFLLIVGLVSGSIAGHYHHGYNMGMSDMSEIDSNQDGTVTFDEFAAPHTEKIKSAFRMLDTNNDEVISEAEWDEFLKVHGYDKGSKG